MGAIWRFIVWAWRRWADYNSLVALLDILDWKTGLWAFLGGVGMTFYAATNMGWSPQAVVLAALVAAACVAVIVIAIRLIIASRSSQSTPSAIAGVPQIEPNISARDAYFLILADSLWKRQQLATTLVTKNLRPDWLGFRLDNEIHNALRNKKISAWGEECLHGMVHTPEKPVPCEVWDKAELAFDPNPIFVRTSAHLKGRVTYEKGPAVWTGVRFCREQFFGQFPLISVASQRDLARQLDDLYAAGVAERNRLMPAASDFNLDSENMIFAHWDYRVLTLLDSDLINVAERSAIRTLNLFLPMSADAPNKTHEQRHIEAMWTEKLNRLKQIIDRVGR